MQGKEGNSMRARMAELRLVCEREISIQQSRIDRSCTSHRNLLDSTKSQAQQTIQLQGNLGKLKVELREAEDALVKAFAVKNRKEARKMSIMESISATRARVEELKGIVEDQRAKKNQYATVLSKQSEALAAMKEKFDNNQQHREQIEEAISWYNRILGFHIESGHGVKFIFANISRENPNEEYSFVVRHENDTYSLLHCHPHLSDTKELVAELNKSNGLFKFVRTMREKFQEAAIQEISFDHTSVDQDFSIISLPTSVASVSTDYSYESPTEEKEPPLSGSKSKPRKVGKGHAIHSPGSASSLRRSTRLKVKGPS